MNDGIAIAARIPMIATTTISSTNVNPPCRVFVIFMHPRGATDVPSVTVRINRARDTTSAAECHSVAQKKPINYANEQPPSTRYDFASFGGCESLFDDPGPRTTLVQRDAQGSCCR